MRGVSPALALAAAMMVGCSHGGSALAAEPASWTGPARVVDGDTIYIGETKFRLYGVRVRGGAHTRIILHPSVAPIQPSICLAFFPACIGYEWLGKAFTVPTGHLLHAPATPNLISLLRVAVLNAAGGCARKGTALCRCSGSQLHVRPDGKRGAGQESGQPGASALARVQKPALRGLGAAYIIADTHNPP